MHLCMIQLLSAYWVKTNGRPTVRRWGDKTFRISKMLHMFPRRAKKSMAALTLVMTHF